VLPGGGGGVLSSLSCACCCCLPGVSRCACGCCLPVFTDWLRFNVDMPGCVKPVPNGESVLLTIGFIMMGS